MSPVQQHPRLPPGFLAGRGVTQQSRQKVTPCGKGGDDTGNRGPPTTEENGAEPEVPCNTTGSRLRGTQALSHGFARVRVLGPRLLQSGMVDSRSS